LTVVRIRRLALFECVHVLEDIGNVVGALFECVQGQLFERGLNAVA